MAKKPPSRFRVVDGGNEKPQRVGVTPSGKRVTLELYRCGKCSEELGMSYDDLIRKRTCSLLKNGKLIAGEEWWVCARCDKRVALIERYPPNPDDYE